MGQFVKGEVVVLPFPFSDLTRSKRRPALVLATLPGNDLILCQITSVDRADPWAIPLRASDMSNGALEQTSYIRPSRLFTADSKIIIYRVGQVHSNVLVTVVKKIVQILEG